MVDEKPSLPKLVTNRAKFGHSVLTYKNQWDSKAKMSKRISGKTIGRILSDDGLGQIIFSSKFLKENPLWKDYIVTKVGRGQYTVEKKLL